MEREELIEFLRENLSIDVSMSDSYESGGRYVTTNVSLRLGDDEISSEYDTIRVGD